MLHKKIKESLLETKNKKETILIEQNLIRNRIMMIVESEDNIKNFHSLPKSKKTKIANKLIQEIAYLQETSLLNEELMGFLGKIFGNSLGGILQTIVEPMVNSLLSGIGLTGYFKDFLVSFITSNPTRLAKALKSCDELTKLVAESLSEAVFMMIQRQQGLEGQGYTFLRNALGGAVKDTKFIQSIEGQISGIVCQLFGKMNDKASGVYDKLKTDVTSGDLGGIGGLLSSLTSGTSQSK
jgi:hypothetical protein